MSTTGARVALPAPHIYRWDLDKTYLDTDFDSLTALIDLRMEMEAISSSFEFRGLILPHAFTFWRPPAVWR